METKEKIKLVYRKFIICLIFIFSIACIISLSGSNLFYLFELNTIPEYYYEIINLTLFSFNLYIFFSVSLDMYDKRSIGILVGYLPYYIISEWFDKDSLFQSIIIPTLYILAIGKLLGRFKQTVINSTMFSGLTLLYQVVITLVRFDPNTLGHIDTNANHTLVLAVDLALFYFILYFIWRYKYYDKLYSRTNDTRRRESMVLPENFNNSKQDVKDRQALIEVKNLTFWQSFKLVIVSSLYQLSQIFFVFVLCAIGGVWVECIIIMTSYFFATTVIKRRWHSKSMIVCTLCTGLLFYTSSKIALPVNISILASVIEGFILTLVLLKIETISEDYKNMKNILYFDIDNCTEEDIIIRCELLNFTDIDTDFALDVFVYKSDVMAMTRKYNLTSIELQQRMLDFRVILESKI